jgi:AcrR family transcriptional regulator
MPTALRKTTPARAVASPAADKREAILKAATHVFARNGYFQSQVADIAREAGVAAGTVYLYFRSKDDLLVSLFERTMREAIAEGRAALSGIDDPRERLTRIARLHLERLGRDRDLAVVFQVELRQSTKFMERFSSSYLRETSGRSATRSRTDRRAVTSAATSTRPLPPRSSSAHSTRWRPTGSSASAATHSRPRPIPSWTSS